MDNLTEFEREIEHLEHDPAYVQEWIDTTDNSDKVVNWWLGLLVRVNRHIDNTGDIAWAQVAISCYEHAHRAEDQPTTDSLLVSAMWVRVRMITRLGHQLNHPILDANLIPAWFFSSTKLSIQEAEARSSLWRSGPMQEVVESWGDMARPYLQELRLIKNRLRVVQFLVDDGILEPDEELAHWLRIRTMLP